MRTIWMLSGLALLPAAPGAAQSDPSRQARKTITAVSSVEPITVDGRLAESVWNRASFVDDFLQHEPDEGLAAASRTEVAVAIEGDALVVGARLWAAAPGVPRAILSRADDDRRVEVFALSLDTYLDRRTAYTFAVTTAAVRIDYYHPTDSETNRDYSFAPVWEAATRRDSTGWTLEMRIPLGQLRFNGNPEAWGVNFSRRIPARNETIYWSLVPKNEVGWASRFGELNGLGAPAQPRRVEFQPYIAGNLKRNGTVHPSDPFSDGSEIGARLGGDIRAGFGPNLTLDATFNPDFGQVEADPAEVNLTAFETELGERRQFFVEGANLLRGSGATYFYSRRVGAAPRALFTGDFTDVASSTPILGAAKLTGRLRSGLSLGAMAAVTGREWVRLADTTTGAFDRAITQPTTEYGVARAQQELGGGSSVGLVVTGVHRSLETDALKAAFSHAAVAAGLDWRARMQGGRSELSGDLGFSRVSGHPDAILALQRSSARYYQRPDAEHVEVDPNRTALAGMRAALRFRRLGGRHWLGGVSFTTQSPGFDLNDAGRTAAVDDIAVSGNLQYRENQPAALLRSWSLSGFVNGALNYAGTPQANEVPTVFGDFQFRNFWALSLHYHYRFRTQDPRLTRGGPSMASPSNHHLSLGLSGDPARRVNWNVEVDHLPDELGGYHTVIGGGVEYRIADRWRLALEPSLVARVNPRQYVAEIAGGRAQTFGTRYIFASLNRREIAARLRIDYFVSARLSLETYLELFAASGRFAGFGELTAPRSIALREYGSDGTTIQPDGGAYLVRDGEAQFTLGNPDFTFHSVRSNAVLRWEWRPGSTLFLVWQQNRGIQTQDARAITGASLFDGLSAPADHVLALKVTYWMS